MNLNWQEVLYLAVLNVNKLFNIFLSSNLSIQLCACDVCSCCMFCFCFDTLYKQGNCAYLLLSGLYVFLYSHIYKCIKNTKSKAIA